MKAVKKIGYRLLFLKTYLKPCFILHLDLAQSSMSVAYLEHAGVTSLPSLNKVNAINIIEELCIH